VASLGESRVDVCVDIRMTGAFRTDPPALQGSFSGCLNICLGRLYIRCTWARGQEFVGFGRISGSRFLFVLRDFLELLLVLASLTNLHLISLCSELSFCLKKFKILSARRNFTFTRTSIFQFDMLCLVRRDVFGVRVWRAPHFRYDFLCFCQNHSEK